MGAVLHPVGPEPVRTYWMRRALVMGLVLIVLIMVIVAVASVGSSPAATDPTDQGVTAIPVASPSDVATPAAQTPLDTVTPSGSAYPSDTATPVDAGSPAPAGTESVEGTIQAGTPTAMSPAACDPTVLRATLTGKQDLKPKEANSFALSLINSGAVACVVTVQPANFELKIYSGTDRIWSSADCTTLLKPMTKTLQSQQALQWRMSWNGQRSRAGCATRPEVPRPGTYYATAQYAGAQPIQLRMILH
jgi:hypothetical protein